MKPEEFFPPEWIARLGRSRFAAVHRYRGMKHGTGLSRRSGSSPDFSEYSEYHPGDDIRNIDWNVFARTEKLYIRRYHDERELRVSVILDSTRSMSGGGRWLFARRLCVALGLISLSSDDHFTAGTAGSGALPIFGGKGSRHRNMLLRKMSGLPEPQGQGSFAGEAWELAGSPATIRFLVTDGLEPADRLRPLFLRLLAAGGETRLILITGEEAAWPATPGDYRLLDSESGNAVDVSLTPAAIRSYEERMDGHRKALAGYCADFGVRMLEADPADGIPDFINARMRRAGWIH